MPEIKSEIPKFFKRYCKTYLQSFRDRDPRDGFGDVRRRLIDFYEKNPKALVKAAEGSIREYPEYYNLTPEKAAKLIKKLGEIKEEIGPEEETISKKIEDELSEQHFNVQFKEERLPKGRKL